MKIPLTRYGLPQITVIVVLALAVLGWLVGAKGWPWPALPIAVLVVLLGALAFFRDPHRNIPNDPAVLLAPADGKITDIGRVDDDEFIQGPALRIGIFLSVFDVHVNRAPCDGNVSYVQEHAGRCVNALHWQTASAQNQATSLGLDCPDHPAHKVLVRQITGAIARRIVCDARVGDHLTPGQRYGMIKFGSRTELYLPLDDHAQLAVTTGDTVRAGSTIMVHYRHAEKGQDIQ